MENGCLVYETDELGMVTIVGHKAKANEPINDPKPQESEVNDGDNQANTPNNSQELTVQGTYYPGDNTGGASTGDNTNIMFDLTIGCGSLGTLFLLLFKRKQVK